MMRLLRTYSNLVYLLEGLWRVLIKKKWGSNKKRDSIVKCGQTSFEEGGGRLVKILWDFPCVMVLW